MALMIVCSCNVLSDKALVAVLQTAVAVRLRTAGQLYKCMGCRPECGRCLPTIQRILTEHSGGACQAGCPTCPANPVPSFADEDAQPYLAAAE